MALSSATFHRAFEELLAPIAALLRDARVTAVSVQAVAHVRVERAGLWQDVNHGPLDEGFLPRVRALAMQWAETGGRAGSPRRVLLPSGARLDLASSGWVLRRPMFDAPTLDRLCIEGALEDGLAAALCDRVRRGENVVIVGPPFVGRTTFAAGLATSVLRAHGGTSAEDAAGAVAAVSSLGEISLMMGDGARRCVRSRDGGASVDGDVLPDAAALDPWLLCVDDLSAESRSCLERFLYAGRRRVVAACGIGSVETLDGLISPRGFQTCVELGRTAEGARVVSRVVVARGAQLDAEFTRAG